jgi:hypothetical protein
VRSGEREGTHYHHQLTEAEGKINIMNLVRLILYVTIYVTLWITRDLFSIFKNHHDSYL